MKMNSVTKFSGKGAIAWACREERRKKDDESINRS